MRRVLVLMPVLATLLLALVVVRHQDAPPPARGGGRVAEPRAAAVLRAWDAARGKAWAHGDVAALRRLYAPASRAGAADVAMLRRWRERGLVVRRMREQVFGLDVLRDEPRRLVVRVTDRLVDAVAVGASGARALPQDAPSTTRVVLVRTGGRWRVAEAYPAR